MPTNPKKYPGKKANSFPYDEKELDELMPDEAEVLEEWEKQKAERSKYLENEEDEQDEGEQVNIS